MATPINLMAQPGYGTVQWSAGNAPWQTQMGGEGDSTPAYQDAYNNGAISDADLAAIGWTGGDPYERIPMAGVDPRAWGQGALKPEFQQFLASKGLRLMTGQGASGYASQIIDGQGNPVGTGSQYGGGGEGDAFGLGMLFAGGLAGGAAAGLGATAADTGGMGIGQIGASQLTPQAIEAGVGTGASSGGVTGFGTAANAAAVGDVAGSPAAQIGLQAGAASNSAASGLSSADLASLYGPSGYGAAASPAEMAAGDAATSGGLTGALGDAASWIKSNPSLFGAGTSLLNGVLGAGAAYRAGNLQSTAANNALQAQQAQNAQTRADMAPWRTAGAGAVGALADRLGTSGNTGAAGYGSLLHQFTPDDLKTNLAPNYDFMLGQGLGATTNAANAAGFSGNTLKGVNDYAQGYASNAYQQAFDNYTAQQTNIYNRLSNLAGLGQTANQSTGQLGAFNTNAGGQFGTSAGAALAAGTVGGTNAITNSLSNAGAWNYLNSMTPGSGTQYTWSDRRLKTHISKVGHLDSGLPVYTYRYKAGGPVHMGVMAQDVEKVAPHAVARDRRGMRAVNYTLLKDIGYAH